MKFFTKLNRRTRIIVTVALLAVFFVMLQAGVIGGEADIVMTKANNICMECIGIG